MKAAPAAEFSGQPHDETGPVFREPWEAQVFAMAVTLHQEGLFTWSEWAQTLAGQIASAHGEADADHGDTYYRHWLTALETILVHKGVSSADELERYTQAWHHAARHTPHGQPIELRTEDGKADDTLT